MLTWSAQCSSLANTVFHSQTLIALLGGMVALLAVPSPGIVPREKETLFPEPDGSGATLTAP